MTQPRYTDEDYERSFNGFLASIESILKQCDELRGTVRNATELIADCRENLSEALKGISLTGDFAVIDVHRGETKGALSSVNSASGASHTAEPHSFTVREAERNYHCQAHRLEQEYAERFPNED